MEHETSDVLVRELAAVPEPPLPDVVGRAVEEGRRRYRRAAAARLAGGTALAAGAGAAVVLALAAGGPAQSGGPEASFAGTAPAAPPPAVAPPVPSAPQPASLPPAGPAGEPVPLTGTVPTDAELVDQVQVALANAGIADATVSVLDPDDAAMVQVDVVGPGGPGMFRVDVGPGWTQGPDGVPQPDGSVLLTGGFGDDNCIQHEYATSLRPDGVAVTVNNASCLAWDGTQNAPSARVLTTEALIALVSDPAIGG